MIFSACKLIQMSINSVGRFYMPDDRTLFNKKIQAIIPMVDTLPLNSNNIEATQYNTAITNTDLQNIYINLTQNGQYYQYRNNALNMSQIGTEGVYDRIDTVLSLPDCYVEVTNFGNTPKVLQLLVMYEDSAYINATNNINSNFDTFEVILSSNVLGRKMYFDDNRTLYGKRFRNLITTYPIITPNGNNGVNSNIEKYAYITLCKGGNIIWDRMPVVFLNQFFNYKKLQFANIEFDFNNSYIELAPIPDSDTTVTLPANLVVTAEYER